MKEPLLLRGGAVQGRNETQESPEGKYTDRAEGKALQSARFSLLQLERVGWVTMVWGVFWGRWRGFSKLSPCPRAAQLSPASQGRVWGESRAASQFHGAALVLPDSPQL